MSNIHINVTRIAIRFSNGPHQRNTKETSSLNHSTDAKKEIGISGWLKGPKKK